MTIQQRVAAPTPPFFRKVRNISLGVAAIAASILAAPVALPAVLLKIAGYAAVAGIVASSVSQRAVETPIQQPKKKKKSAKSVLSLSASWDHRRDGWRNCAGDPAEYQYGRDCTFGHTGVDRSGGKFWRFAFAKMAAELFPLQAARVSRRPG